jgi:hypothetical protein
MHWRNSHDPYVRGPFRLEKGVATLKAGNLVVIPMLKDGCVPKVLHRCFKEAKSLGKGDTIDWQPMHPFFTEQGITLERVTGEIEFMIVEFRKRL